jgi:K+-transporting ATPase KdpF subunit
LDEVVDIAVLADELGDVAVVFVRACEPRARASGRRGGAEAVSVENVVGLVLAVAVLAYLVYALLAPEKLG